MRHVNEDWEPSDYRCKHPISFSLKETYNRGWHNGAMFGLGVGVLLTNVIWIAYLLTH